MASEKHTEVEAHWGRHGVMERIETALREAGFDPRNLTPDILTPLDQIHGGGIAITKTQAEMVGFSSGMKVLDIGCGIGGPARFLARTFGCEVWGVDLTEEWAATGRILTERCGLEDRVHIEHGNALDLDFDDGTFDAAWCQNVSMNIADKSALLAEMHRVLRPGGKFSLAEYWQGEGGNLHYPVPWAETSEINFLATGEEMKRLLQAAGFRIVECRDLTKTLGERPQLGADRGKGAQAAGLGGHIVQGRSPGEMAERRRQVSCNLAEGRLTYQIIVAEKSNAGVASAG